MSYCLGDECSPKIRRGRQSPAYMLYSRCMLKLSYLKKEDTDRLSPMSMRYTLKEIIHVYWVS